MKKISKIILCFISTLQRHLQSNQYQDLFFEIRHIRTKHIYFLFRLNFVFGFFYKTMTKQIVYLNNFARKSGCRLQFLRQSAFYTHHCWRGLMTSPIRSVLTFSYLEDLFFVAIYIYILNRLTLNLIRISIFLTLDHSM